MISEHEDQFADVQIYGTIRKKSNSGMVGLGSMEKLNTTRRSITDVRSLNWNADVDKDNVSVK